MAKRHSTLFTRMIVAGVKCKTIDILIVLLLALSATLLLSGRNWKGPHYKMSYSTQKSPIAANEVERDIHIGLPIDNSEPATETSQIVHLPDSEPATEHSPIAPLPGDLREVLERRTYTAPNTRVDEEHQKRADSPGRKGIDVIHCKVYWGKWLQFFFKYFRNFQTNLEEIYRKRREKVKQICNKLEIRPSSKSKWSKQLLKIRDLPIMVCPVPAVAVELQKAIAIWSGEPVTARSNNRHDDARSNNRHDDARSNNRHDDARSNNRHDDARSNNRHDDTQSNNRHVDARSNNRHVDGEGMTNQGILERNDKQPLAKFTKSLKSNLKVVLTRDPFMQIFAYYVDNILVPSKFSLKVNKMIYREMKDDPAWTSTKFNHCGNNLSFMDFFVYMSRKSPHLNVTGNVKHCDVCGLDYDVIGNEKTLIQDIAYVYNKSGDRGILYTLKDIENEVELARIESYVKTAFSRKEEVGCISDHSMYMRLWRQLQIWGYIDFDMKLPFHSEETDGLEFDTLRKAVLDARLKSIPNSRANTDLAFAQAYHDTTLNQLDNFRERYLRDFFLFGYSDHPALVFFKQGPLPDINLFDVIENV